MYTRGDEAMPKSWIDHVLHKGEEEHIRLIEGFVSHSDLWEGITDHRPIWGVYRVQQAAQAVPKAVDTMKVRWELHLTDRAKCDDFVERMENFAQTCRCPGGQLGLVVRAMSF